MSSVRKSFGRAGVILPAMVLALVVVVAGALVAVRLTSDEPGAQVGCPDDELSAAADWAPSGTDPDAELHQHPFVGNGYLGLRVPPRGMGYGATKEATGWPLYTDAYDGAFVAGLYGHTPGVADDREVAAAIPNWSTLNIRVGDETYSPTASSKQITNFAQTLYLRCGLVRTTLTWTTQDGKSTDLVYEVLTDRSNQHVGAVRLTVLPRWSGETVVTDVLDGTGARRVSPREAGGWGADAIGVGFRTQGTGIDGDVVSVLGAGPASRTTQQPSLPDPLSVSRDVRFPVQAGDSYEVTKFVGVDTARTAANPAESAGAAARAAAATGWPDLLANSAERWRELWRGDVEVPGSPQMQSWIRGGLYSLYSGTNSEEDNSISPVGLSSDNYAGAIFWDADIWMFPGLLQLAPELAKSVVDYRYRTLPAAQANARQLGFQGAFYPWTSASNGDLAECHSWDPPHCLNQIHLQGDVSLAAWQYYLGTGDDTYLRERGWPIMRSLAEFWAARVSPNDDGSYSIDDVAGPDEYSNGVTDGVYTNAVAALALRNATHAADILGEPRPPEWTAIADHLRMPFDEATQTFRQFDGYTGTSIKQADTVLLIYPLEWPMPEQVAANVLEYYAERTDPDGPAMTDSVHAIDAAATGAPGCFVYTFLERSARPFMRAPYDQFAEARGAKAGANDPLAGVPAFTFVTAAGGFLQAFTNGLLGLRLRADEVAVAPLLPPQLTEGLNIRGIHWQGRTFDAELAPNETRLTLTAGDPMSVATPTGTQLLSADHPLSVKTRRPDLAPSPNLARCKPVTTTSDEPGQYATAAVDGTPATTWAPDATQGSLTVDLGAQTRIDRIIPQWTNTPPTTFTITTSPDNNTWTTVSTAPVTGKTATPLTARYLRIDLTAADPNSTSGLGELEIYAPQ